ncbi:RNA polymerase sigma factor [Psychrobacillus sp. INOP01]|uniref:RNA polymerase sigma factor n=1 Tax=Psychrobacillus sp. INOP01 TaxID=2829187 RepID=UPI001BAA960D|nr:RNA polymerase sigma factor [Psychrobacillus sp. INOP01]QUG41278.1 RNA polymerase sigma factor [Psychrobacillus sp. INOP01]
MKQKEELYHVLQEKTGIIYKYLIKNGANPRDAEDIIQEALYKFLLYIDSVDPDKSFSWLFRVAINQFYDLCRKQQKQVLVSFENFEFVDDTLLPEDHVEQSEMKKEIQVVLDQLTPLHKQLLLLLKYELNLSYEEIAEMLDLNPGTLKTYLFRARKAFKDKYRKEQTKHDRLQRK